jgi:PAS domain S-box-containing protein
MSNKSHTLSPLDALPHGNGMAATFPHMGANEEDRMMEAIVNMVVDLLRVERCSLMTVNAKEGFLRMRSVSGMPVEEAKRIRVRMGEGVAGKVAVTGKPIFVRDVRDSEFYDPTRSKDYDSVSFICLPVQRHGETIGVINVTNRCDGLSLTPEDLTLLTSVAGFVSLALENVSLLDTTQHLKELLRDLLDSLVVGVVAVDRAGEVTCWNRGAEALFGVPADEAMGRDFFSMTPPEARERLAQAIAVASRERRDQCLEIEMPSHDLAGGSIPLGVTVTQLRRRDESIEGFVLVVEDLSLTREVQELKRLDELKSNFIAMISHELRTPLTSMRGSLHLLGHQFAPQLEKTPQRLIEVLRNNTERLTIVVNNLLEVTQIQNKSITLRPSLQDMNSIIDDSVRDLEVFARERRITVEIETREKEAHVFADGDKIRQIVRHLLDNAIKFSRPGGPVRIRTAGDEREITVFLKDCGPGIGEKDSERIFELFIQIEPTMTRASGGAGLGLYIARELTVLHNGTLEIGSTNSEGTEFVLRLPRAPRAAAQPAAQAASQMAGRQAE